MELLIERAKKQGRAKKRSFMKKHILQLGGHVVANVSRTFVHRLSKGPIYPNFSLRNELFYQLMLELMDKHYLLSWQEWRHLMPMQPIPRWHLRRTKVVLKNGLKAEFITYVPRRRHRASRRERKKHRQSHTGSEKEAAASDVDDNRSTNGSDKENDMFYGDAEDFDDHEGQRPNGSGVPKHKLDSNTVTGQTINGSTNGNHRGVNDIGLDTPTVIYFHGGGFCFGSVPVYRRWLWNFSRKLGGIRFFAVDYSLAPEAPFPIALKQALDSYLWLTNPNGGGVSPQNVIMGGDSAGGNLVGSLMLLIRQMRLEKELKIMNGTNHGCAKQPERPSHPTAALGAGGQEADVGAKASPRLSKGKEVNETEQMVDETSEQKEERREDERKQDDELDFCEEEEEEAEKERQLHRQLYARRQSMADLKSSAERGRHRVMKTSASETGLVLAGDQAKLKEKAYTSDGSSDEILATEGERGGDEDEDEEDEAAGLPTLKAIGFDMELVRRHRIPFDLDEDQAGQYPSMPLAAMQISPWVDVSENSAVHSPDSWGKMKFRPYNISVRFALAYLGLEATDPPAAKKKERETRREWNGIQKLFHQRRQRRLRSQKKKEKGQHDAQAPKASTYTAAASGAAPPVNGVAVPALYVDYEPIEPGTAELTPTQIWRDRLRRSNSVLSSTNLLARSAARAAAEVGEVEIAIGERRHEQGPVAVSHNDVAAPTAQSAVDKGQEQDVFDICSPYISPVYGDLRGFPPLLVSAGDVEPLLGDIMRYYQKAVDAGLEAELDLGRNMNHDYQFFYSAVAMSDPELPRFWGVARSWVHRQIEREVQSTSRPVASASPSPATAHHHA